MPFTEAQRHAIRYYCGWSEGFSNLYVQLEGSMNNIESNLPAAFARITNLITGDPPGLLAKLDQIKADIFNSRRRFKASAVGSIALNPGELAQLRSLGRELTGELCQVLGVGRARDVFSPSDADGTAREGRPWIGRHGGNYIGKG